jgi:suppressor for copper-sensitivity B
MAVGFALPYLVFSLFPLMITRLPKPGAWMVRVKKIMGILLALTAVWLIWVLSNQIGQLAASILLLLSISKIIKLWAASHFSVLRKIKVPLLLFIVMLSFIIPIKLSNNGELAVMKSDSLIWQEFNQKKISEFVNQGNVVFVDVTADWCLTCKLNKFTVLDRDVIKDAFVKMDVVAMRADWTNRDVNIAGYLMNYKRVGIPFNIVYGPAAPEGIVLSEILSRKEVLTAIQNASGNK